MLDLKTALLLVVSITNLSIGVAVLIRKRSKITSIAFGFFTVGISLWALTNALFQLTSNETFGMVAALTSYYAGICIALPFYSFSRNFPDLLPEVEQKKFAKRQWCYGVIWGIVISIPGLTLQAVVYDPTGRIITGPGLYFHFFSIALCVIAGMFNLWRKRQSATQQASRQIGIIMLGCLIAGSAGIICNLVLPLFGNYSLVWLGPDFSLVLVAFMAYAIVKHRLFDLRIITTEIFTAALGLVIVVELLRAQSVFELVVRCIILLAFLFIAQQMLKSVYEALRAKEALRVVNDELQQVNAELQELLDIKTDFIHAASHQLRTPLTAIRGLVNMQYDGDYDNASPAERKRLQHNLLISVERLSAIVNDLLRAAELEHGLTGKPALGDVTKLVEQSLETLRPNYSKKNIQLFYQQPMAVLPKVMMRESYLQQVFLNLLDNAERYSPEGSTVDVYLGQVGADIVFSVRDQGIGFTKEQTKKLFTKFGRTDEAKSLLPNGSGLGLYIVKRIVEEHNGSIAADSAGLNTGATFTVKLPMT